MQHPVKEEKANARYISVDWVASAVAVFRYSRFHLVLSAPIPLKCLGKKTYLGEKKYARNPFGITSATDAISMIASTNIWVIASNVAANAKPHLSYDEDDVRRWSGISRVSLRRVATPRRICQSF